MVKYMSPEACAAAISIIDPSTSSHGTPSSNTAANQHYQQAYSTRSMNSNANINGGPLNNNDLATFSSQLERGGRFVSTDHIPITEDVGEITNMNGYTTSAISSNNNVAHQAALPRPGLLTIDGVEVLNGSTSAGDSENESSSSAGNLFARNVHRGALSPLSPTSTHPQSVRNDVSAPPAARSNHPLLASTTGIAGPQSPLFFSNTHVNGNPTSASSVSSNNAGGAGAANAPTTVDFNTANPLTNQSNNSPATTPVTTRCTPTPIPIPTSPQLASTNNNPTAPQPFCLTAASDVYSIGIIFLEMVTGSHPWRGVSLPTVIPSNLLQQPFPANPSFSAQSGPNSSLGASLTSAQQGSRKVPSSDYEYLGSLAAVSLMAGSTQHRASGTGGAVVAPKHPKSRQLTAHNAQDDMLNNSLGRNVSTSSNQQWLAGVPEGKSMSYDSGQGSIPVPNLPVGGGSGRSGSVGAGGTPSAVTAFPTALSGRSYGPLAFVGRNAREAEVDFIRDFAYMALQPNPAQRATVKQLMEVFFSA